MIVRREEAWVFDADERTMLLRFIERAGVISIKQLAECIGCAEEEIAHVLGHESSHKRIEWLRPVGAAARSDTIFCRWRQPSDGQYLWEQNYYEKADRPVDPVGLV